MCIRPSCRNFWLFFQPWPTGSNHSIVFWKREYSTFTSLKESLKYSFIRTPFPASMQWLSEIYAVVFILKILDQKKHHSMEITFWHIKGEGEILWWKYWATNYLLLCLARLTNLTRCFQRKKIDSEHKPLKKEDYYCGLHLRVKSFRKSYERLNVLAPKEVKWAFFVHVVLICYVNLKYIFHPSAIVWLRLT